MRTSRYRIPWLLAASLGVACSGATPDATHRRVALDSTLVGCYELYAGGSEVTRSLRAYGAPPRIRLDTTTVRLPLNDSSLLQPGVRAVVPINQTTFVSGSGEPTAFGPVWHVDSLTSLLRLDFAGAVAGAQFALGLAAGMADTLLGSAWESSDTPPFESRRQRAYAVPVPCPSP